MLHFPRDHGAHPRAQIEWWYLTGSLAAEGGGSASHGFQVTFFRSRTGMADDLPGRFAPRQLLFAHAALTELASSAGAASHRHAQRIARWNGTSLAPMAHAATSDVELAIDRWRLQRSADGAYLTRVDHEAGAGEGFALELALRPTQPLLLQGEQGFSRKGPLKETKGRSRGSWTPSGGLARSDRSGGTQEQQASHYYSEPQLAVSGSLRSGRRSIAVRGTAWLDHEWSDSLLPPEAEGWDWIGMNLFDGSALTAFRLRRAGASRTASAASATGAIGGDADSVWAGGSFRSRGQPARIFDERSVHFEPGRTWLSQGTGARYPVEWRVHTPAGTFTVRSLLDAQELDGSASTGTVYWEGLSELLDGAGRRVGLGYLEMTGYASRLRLGRADGPGDGDSPVGRA